MSWPSATASNAVLSFGSESRIWSTGQACRGADLDFAAVGLLAARDHLEERGLAGAVRTDHADDGAGGDAERQVVDEQAVAEALGNVVELDHVVAETLGDRDEDFIRFVALLVLDAGELLEARNTGLGLGLTALRILTDPFKLVLDGLHAGVFLTLFDLKALFLLVKPGGVVALPGNAFAAVEFENPFGRVVEEVAVMGHGDDGTGEAVQELLEPFDGFGVEMVRRFVEQQHVGTREQQAAERDAALFTTGEVADHGIPRRKAQGVGGDLHLSLDVRARSGDDGLKTGLLGSKGVEVGVGIGIGVVDGVELLLSLHHLAHALLDGLADGLGRIKSGFLRQVADVDAGHRDGFALDVLVDARHDLEERGLAGAVEAEDADLGAREEREGNVLKNLTLRRDDLPDAVHRKNILGHGLMTTPDMTKAAGERRIRPNATCMS